jgi:hypothetical protein
MSNETPAANGGSSGSAIPRNSVPAKQKPLPALGAGFGAMIVGTALWVAVAQKFQMPWLSVVLAYGIACAIRYSGNITDKRLGIAGALFSLITTLCGNLATTIIILSKVYSKSPLEIFGKLNMGQAILESFRGPGIIFYIGALFIGFWFAYRHPPKMVEIQ